MKAKTPKRLQDIKITPEATRLFEKAVDRALSGRHSEAKKDAPIRAGRSRQKKRGEPS